MTLRGGVIGVGRMGLTHFAIFNAQPQADLVAVCDSSGFILKNAARYMDVETFTDPAKMWESVQLDFVVVATPTADHA
jgi:scyllo-inositol 2-dehydrogenase (NADP+)